MWHKRLIIISAELKQFTMAPSTRRPVFIAYSNTNDTLDTVISNFTQVLLFAHVCNLSHIILLCAKHSLTAFYMSMTMVLHQLKDSDLYHDTIPFLVDKFKMSSMMK